MQRFRAYNIFNALRALLIVGSATAFMGCGLFDEAADDSAKGVSKERLVTERSENLTVVMSENGKPSYIFVAPLVEGYTLAKEPYKEFRKGIKITTFDSNDMSAEGNVLTGDYALFYEERRLWEIFGNVSVVKTDGKELYSQQLFWSSQTGRIYSNVDTEIRDRFSGDVYRGEGFESDEDMEDWTFRKMTGRMNMAEMTSKSKDSTDESEDASAGENSDSK